MHIFVFSADWLTLYPNAVSLLHILYSARVFEGHPFIVEAGVSVGGKDVKQVGDSLLIMMVNIDLGINKS